MWSIASLPPRGGNRARARQMCIGGFCRRSLSRPTDLVMLSSTIVRGAPCHTYEFVLPEGSAVIRRATPAMTPPR